jgi:hypothetical protein
MNRTVTVLSTHHQIMIWDVENRTSVAQWFKGNEMVVFGPNGVTVGVANYQNIEITLCRAEEPTETLDKALKRNHLAMYSIRGAYI